jgi:hypothetical protein
MREEWKEDPLRGYRENAKHLFGYPESTLSEYVRDLEHFQKWLAESAMGGGGRAWGAKRRPAASGVRVQVGIFGLHPRKAA